MKNAQCRTQNEEKRAAAPLRSALALLALVAVAADKPPDIVKYRQSVMKAMGAHMAAMQLVVRKQVSERAQLPAHANAVRDLSIGLTALFPRDSAPERVKTAAKPDV